MKKNSNQTLLCTLQELPYFQLGGVLSVTGSWDASFLLHPKKSSHFCRQITVLTSSCHRLVAKRKYCSD